MDSQRTTGSVRKTAVIINEESIKEFSIAQRQPLTKATLEELEAVLKKIADSIDQSSHDLQELSVAYERFSHLVKRARRSLAA